MDDNNWLVLWALGNEDMGNSMARTTVLSHERTVQSLVDEGVLDPLALSMPVADLLHEFNHAYDGEAWLTEVGECGPAICRRTELNPDGTEPVLWVFFVDPAEAHLWRESGQVETVEQAEP